MKIPELLYELFKELRNEKQLVSPGLDEYYLVLDLIESKKYSIKNFDDFAFVLETAWLKSPQHRIKFRKLLEKRKNDLISDAQTIREQLEETKSTKKTPSKKKPGPQNEVAEQPVNIAGKTSGTSSSNATLTGSTPEVKHNPVSDYETTGFTMGEKETGHLQTMQLKQQEEKIIPLQETPFLFTNDYLPVRNRELQQAWRGLKSRQEAGNSAEISFPKTIEMLARKGFLSTFEFEKQHENQLHLFVLIDQGDSMIAVEEFGRELCKTAIESDLHKKLLPWYFHEIPQYDNQTDDYLFTNSESTSSVSLRKLFGKLNPKDIVVLIYSDAGCLRNEYNNEKVARITRFLKHLSKKCAYTAWVNPAPAARWENTNAMSLKQFIPMFETTRTQLETAISALKGKEKYASV